LGKLLRRAGRRDFVYPGHEELPQVPLGALDLDWMPVIGALGLVVITRDRRLRTRPAELRAYWEFGIRAVWIGGKEHLGPRDQVELFMRHETRLQQEIVNRGAGPWALNMSASGIRPLPLKPHPDQDPGAAPPTQNKPNRS